jgi:sporulation protein YtfJ
MQTAMESIKAMVDVNTILGDPVETPDGSVIVPVSRISLGFAAGGTEYEGEEKKEQKGFPFGGGTGAGISVNPVAFLVVGQNQVSPLRARQVYSEDDDFEREVTSLQHYLEKSVTEWVS